MDLVNILTKRKRRGGQISLFMIIGVIILIVFIALFYLVNSLTSARIEKEVKKTTSTILSSSTMQYYVSDCLKDIFEEGIITLGKQGGYFFENQSGYIPFIKERAKLEFEENIISYLIYPGEGGYMPWWPCSSGANSPSYCRYGPDNFNPDLRYNFGFSSPVLPPLAKGKYSIKAQLTKYIEDEIDRCVNFTELSRQFPGYNISGGDIEADINFGVFSVNVELNYPIHMEFLDYEPALEIYRFKAEVPVRFSKIYGIVEDIIDKEVFFLNSNPREEAANLLQYSYDIEFRETSNLGFDDIFIINDSFSLIDGEEYIFQFARRNRPPVLNYISRSPSYKYDKLDLSKDIYDYLVVPGLYNIDIIPSAVDTDEDDIIYYSENTTIENLNMPVEHSLVYDVNETHVGFHNITIAASDGQLADKQNVRMLIDRPLRPKANLTNLYGNFVYSREDPFFLNATLTNETLDPFAAYSFIWDDTIFPGGAVNIFEGFAFETKSFCAVLPTGEDCSDYNINIENITNNKYIMIRIGETKPINLLANLSYSELSQLNAAGIMVTRRECIPYRSNSYPYPYNGFDANDINSFYGGHTCCLGDINDPNMVWELADTDIVCYSKSGCNPNRYLMQDIIRFCDGKRGNICNGTLEDNSRCCTTNDCEDCNADSECTIPFGSAINGGVCYGIDGCQKVCDKELVDNGNDCDCNIGQGGENCDLNYDGQYNGICQRAGITWECVGDI